MTKLIKKWGPVFVLLNALGIVLFALSGVIMPVQFWAALNIEGLHPEHTRIMGWYLLVFGIGGLLVWRAPHRQPVVVLLIGLEKIAPAFLFPALTLHHGAHWLLSGVGVFDAVMCVLFISYSIWLFRNARALG